VVVKALAILAALAIAVGAAAAAQRHPTARARTPSAGGCQPQSAHLPRVGTVKSARQDVHQGKHFVVANTALLTNGTLCTDETGSFADFVLDPPNPAECEMRHPARLRLFPPKLNPAHLQVVIRFEEGLTACGVGKTVAKKFDARKGQVRILMGDPLFDVNVDAVRTVVKVELGYVEVSRLAGGGAVIVGPAQQVTVPEKAEPKPVAPIVRTPDDQAAFNDLRGTVPKPEFRPPAPDSSPVLERIFGKGSIVVGIDSDHADQSTVLFVKALFSFLAQQWGLKVGFSSASVATIVRAVRAGKFDLGVTNDAQSLQTLGTVPLFADPRGSVWLMAFQTDEVFASAFGSFLRAAVASGAYSAAYRRAFANAEPSLEPLRPVLFG
jgi:hypothetical protein